MAHNKSKFYEPLAVQVAGGQSIKASAEVVGCNVQTAYNISATAEFRQRVNELRSEVSAATVGILTSAASTAATTLLELLGSSNESSVRLQASKAILAALGPMAELAELRSRLDALERAK